MLVLPFGRPRRANSHAGPCRAVQLIQGIVESVAVVVCVFLGASAASAQWYTPQSDRDLRVTWVLETLGSVVRIRGDVQNLAGSPADRVVLLVEGLNNAGKVVSRVRGYVPQEIPVGGSSPFEVQVRPAGTEQRYRVTIEFFEFSQRRRARPESP